jgi:hypothetical protein
MAPGLVLPPLEGFVLSERSGERIRDREAGEPDETRGPGRVRTRGRKLPPAGPRSPLIRERGEGDQSTFRMS